MSLGADLAAVMTATGGVSIPCELHVGETRIPARVVLTRGGPTRARAVLGWASGADLPRGADWAAALLLAESLPLGTGASDVDVIDDLLGTLWRVEGVTPLVDTMSRAIDGTDGSGVVGWRLALRGTQRGVR